MSFWRIEYTIEVGYWFGPQWSLGSSQWLNVTTDFMSGVDSAVAISWQNPVIPPRGRDVISFFVRCGTGSQSAPAFSITCSPNSGRGDTLLSITIDVPHAGNEAVRILVIADGDLTNIVSVTELLPGSTNTVLDLSTFSWEAGNH
jgi:hypothetical protein